MMGLRRLRLMGQVKRLILPYKDTTQRYLSRLASWLYSFAVRDSTIIRLLSLYLHALLLFYFLSFSGAFSAIALFISKSGVTSQSCRPIATYYHSIWTNHVVPCQRFLRGCPLFWTRRIQHTHVGFSDYKLLIHAATDNPFLLYYILKIYKVITWRQLMLNVNNW